MSGNMAQSRVDGLGICDAFARLNTGADFATRTTHQSECSKAARLVATESNDTTIKTESSTGECVSISPTRSMDGGCTATIIDAVNQPNKAKLSYISTCEINRDATRLETIDNDHTYSPKTTRDWPSTINFSFSPKEESREFALDQWEKAKTKARKLVRDIEGWKRKVHAQDRTIEDLGSQLAKAKTELQVARNQKDVMQENSLIKDDVIKTLKQRHTKLVSHSMEMSKIDRATVEKTSTDLQAAMAKNRELETANTKAREEISNLKKQENKMRRKIRDVERDTEDKIDAVRAVFKADSERELQKRRQLEVALQQRQDQIRSLQQSNTNLCTIRDISRLTRRPFNGTEWFIVGLTKVWHTLFSTSNSKVIGYFDRSVHDFDSSTFKFEFEGGCLVIVWKVGERTRRVTTQDPGAQAFLEKMFAEQINEMKKGNPNFGKP